MTGGSKNRGPAGFARALAVALLSLVGVWMAATLRPREIGRRAALLARSLRGEAPSAAERTRFWFDPAYSEFLEDVERRTPSDATVAVLVPRAPDTYRYLAAYVLAPRRVVDGSRAEEAAFVATYRAEPGSRGEAIAQGTLWRR